MRVPKSTKSRESVPTRRHDKKVQIPAWPNERKSDQSKTDSLTQTLRTCCESRSHRKISRGFTRINADPEKELTMKTIYKSFGAALLLSAIVVTANAQFVERKTLSIGGAHKIIAGAVAYAKKVSAPGGVIAVVDEGGNLMALERLDGTFAAGANISIGKARTAVLFKRPTKAFEDIIKNGRTAMVALPDFTPLQGGIPIV